MGVEVKQGSKFMVLLARMFGKREVIEDNDGTLIFYMWRGKGYVTHFEQKDEHETINS
jgi:hypothetical protein